MRNITIPDAYRDNETLADAYLRGWNHGHGIACHNVPYIGDKISPCLDWVGCGYVTADSIRDVHAMYCHAAADNSRQFSPFEFTASEFNEYGEEDEVSSDDVWEAFEEGTADAIRADINTYSDADYGIGAEQ